MIMNQPSSVGGLCGIVSPHDKCGVSGMVSDGVFRASDFVIRDLLIKALGVSLTFLRAVSKTEIPPPDTL